MDAPHRPGLAGPLARTAWLLALGAWSAWCAARSWSPGGLSWHFFADAGEAFLHGSGLGVYEQMPTLQVGPLTVVASAAFADSGQAGVRVAQVLMMATGPLLLASIATLAPGRRAWLRTSLAGLLLAPAWAVLAVRWGHLDDVLAMAGGVLAVAALGRGRRGGAALGIAAAVAAKPWAVGFAPVLMAAGDWAAMVGALGAGAAVWLPFVMAEPGTLRALRPPVPLIPGSGLHTLGVRGRFVPDWGRSLQLAGLGLAGLVAALRGRWAGVLLVALAVRIALDPQDNPYYVGSAVLAAVVYDVVGRRGVVPWATLATSVALWQPFTADYEHRFEVTTGVAHWWFAHPTTVGWIHLAWAAGMVALVLLGPRTAVPLGSGDPGEEEPGEEEAGRSPAA